MSNPDGGPAYPVLDPKWLEPNTVEEGKRIASGMSLRDWFAGNAPTEELRLPKFCPDDVRRYLGENSSNGEYPKGSWKARVYAKARYEWADAMIEAKNK